MFELPVRLSPVISESTDGAAVASVLSALGVPREYLLSAVRVGLEERRAATKFDPTIAPGLRDWIGRVRELRRRLAGDGWVLVDRANSPFVRSPDGELLIGVMPGNAATGNPAGELKSEYVRGATMAKATRSNESAQLSFDHDLGIGWEEVDEAKVWLLVTHFVPGDGDRQDRVQIEISHPEPTHEGRLVTEWRYRCCLSSFEPEQVLEPAATPEEGPRFQVVAR
jgi:hypothetical protein